MPARSFDRFVAKMAHTTTANSNEQKQLQDHSNHHQTNKASSKTAQSPSQSNPTSATSCGLVVYDVEHLATFSTTGSNPTNHNGPVTSNNDDGDSSRGGSIENGGCTRLDPTSPLDDELPTDKATNALVTKTTPKIALQKLFELEKLSGIWTQRMQIELRDDFMLIVDCETNSIVEKFDRDCVTKPEAFNQYNDIYNNIVVFIIQQQQVVDDDKSANHRIGKSNTKEIGTKNSDESGQRQQNKPSNSNGDGELHIFQCVSHGAQQLVADIIAWKSHQLIKSSSISCKDDQQRHSRDMAKLTQENFAPTNNNNNNKRTAISDHHITSTQSSSSSSGRSRTTGEQINATKNPPSPEAATTGPSANGGPGKPVVTVASCASTSESVPIANVNVKETVQVFNQIAALREKSKPASPINHARPLSDGSAASSHSTPAIESTGAGTATTNGHSESASRIDPSPGGQLYKQRSIRATLAPKYATGNAAGAEPNDGHLASAKLDNSQNSISTTSSSLASSSETKSAAVASCQMNSAPRDNQPVAHSGRHPATSAHQRNGYHMKQAAQTNSNKTAASRHNQQNSSQPSSAPTNTDNHHHHYHHNHGKGSKSQSSRSQQQRSQTESLRSRTSSSSQSQLDQVTTNESYVSVLNHCFDDIEKFIIRLQQSMAAARDLQIKKKLSKRSNGPTNGGTTAAPVAAGLAAPAHANQLTNAELAMLAARACGPNEDDYFEILSKFKLAFNLLAKLKGCIHEPNAPELVHFLFTPLAIIIESARNASPPIDPTLVGIPYLNQDALDLLSNCCTSKESDMWISLGPNWTQTIDMNLLRASRLPDSFQPIFSDGWAPIIGELELIGLVMPPSASGSTANATLLSANGSISAEINPPLGHPRHHPAEGRRHPSNTAYQPDESLANASGSAGYTTLAEQPGYSNGSMGNGRLNKEKSHPIGRDLKKKNGGPATQQASERSSNRHDMQFESASQQPYLGPVPYGFSQDPARESLSQANNHHHHHHHQRLASSSRDRVNKQNSRNQDYLPMQTDYDPNYPAMSLQQATALDTDSQLDVDLIAHQYDRGELHDHYVNEHYHHHHNSRGAPGPSSLADQYRSDKSHKHQQQKYQQQQARMSRLNNPNNSYNHGPVPMHPLPQPPPSMDTDFLNEVDQEAMLLDLGLAQTEWFFELQARGATIVRVLFTRDANNDKELSVRRGEILEVLDDTRKWWRARNIDLQVAHVPHTIVAIMNGYKTLDELLANNPGEENSLMMQQRFSRRGMQSDFYDHQQWDDHHGDKRNSKNAGAFRYF